MIREEHIPWPWLLLGILDDCGGQAALQDIYARIEEQYHEMKKEDTVNKATYRLTDEGLNYLNWYKEHY